MREVSGKSDDPWVHLTHVSSNSKTGPIPVSVTAESTCPPTCPLKGNGCYAEYSYARIAWNKVSSGERGTSWEDFCAQIYDLPPMTLWRHNVSGDLPHTDGVIDRSKALTLAGANAGKLGFSYTHHEIDKNLETLQLLNLCGFTVSLSADNLEEADVFYDTGLPVVTVLPMDQMENTTTPAGRKVVVCPAVVRDDVTCSSCGLCQVQTRNVIVGFPSHGTGKAKAQRIFNLVKESA